MKESKAFSKNLIQDCIKSFKEENGVDISVVTAIEYLNSFARLYLTFMRIEGEGAVPGCEAPGGASPDLISPQSLFIPELSPRGRIHFHGLLFNVPLSLGDTRQGKRCISHGDERKDRPLAKLWGEGFVDATKTNGSGRLAYYISKYITKGGQQILFNAMRMLRISHGFPKEIVVRGKMAEELAHRYEKEKPIKEWTRPSIFMGEITKKTYQKSP